MRQKVKGQVNLWLTGCTSIFKEYLNFSSSQILLYLYTDAGWWKEYDKIVKKQRRSFIKVNKGCFPKDLNFFVVREYRAKTSASCMRFVMTVWWFSAVLEYYLSTTLIVWLPYYPKVEVLCKSCKPTKNGCTEVPLRWTWLKFGKPTPKQHT